MSKEEKGTRTGFTTGACAAAAAKAATRSLVRGVVLQEIETTLPNKKKVTFALKRCECSGDEAVASIIKDAGDDPDCTHGAEITVSVRLQKEAGVELFRGPGVGEITKPGLGIPVGAPSITPVPRRNITEMVLEELAYPGCLFQGARVTISVPRGEEMAKETTNARLGIVGGISILGTTGIVKPYSTSAYLASVKQAINVAHERGQRVFVLTTGGKSEQFAMRQFPELSEECFIQVGDFVGAGLGTCASKEGVSSVHIAGMIGKLSKMADGRMQTHVAGSQVNTELLARLAKEAGASEALEAEIRAANTARHALELAARENITNLTYLVCREVSCVAEKYVREKLKVHTWLFDFDGKLSGKFPS
ncbi:MAG: cobalt-precorrin-5B (C(1))-methyltransferase [Candidatus Omnitrophica bacterium]|nr:cobalt-precorrin-5B (C(1))-methyltransferase [Candidatus Omnitrophota bacterium]